MVVGSKLADALPPRHRTPDCSGAPGPWASRIKGCGGDGWRDDETFGEVRTTEERRTVVWVGRVNTSTAFTLLQYWSASPTRSAVARSPLGSRRAPPQRGQRYDVIDDVKAGGVFTRQGVGGLWAPTRRDFTQRRRGRQRSALGTAPPHLSSFWAVGNHAPSDG